MAEASAIERGDEEEWLTRSDYERLLEAASTYRERVLVRLGGEVGLRVTEMTEIRRNGITRARSDPDGFVLSVPENDGTSREAYLPAGVERELTRYVNSNAIGDTDRIVDVTPRRVQMLLSGVADRAAERTGEAHFAGVSAHDLRRYFARTLLCERNVSPRVVQAVGGWQSLEALDPYLEESDRQEIVEALGEGRERSETRLDAVLLDASTREGIETGVCESLAERYAFAWIDAPELDGSDAPRVVSGIDAESIPSIREDLGEESTTRTEEGAVLAIAIRYGETRYGTLCIGGSDVPDERERTRLELLGRRIGHSITAIRRRKLLLADTILQLEFRCTDAESALIAATDRFDCRIDLESIVSASESTLVYYLTLSGASATAVIEFVTDYRGIEEGRLVEGRDSGALVEFVVSGGCPLSLLTDYGATVQQATVEGGEARILAECAYDTDLRALVERLTEAFPDTRLVGKQAAEREASTLEGFEQGAIERLTDRQHAALRAAYFGGYFDWPRGSTAEEVADAMGVSSPTLHNHLRKGQREILELLFEDG
ncbi:bacterio-opsin activator domain-containing protein [Halalkalicoccus jeotgali]|uniref:Bacterio-opsin activator-like protein n=1 Tax=Halalkalicoccus jeotgali (strain DSM 18796 / CECT 7217 / JCM 14584 / KCTC 4019 / B3) TaxID=795797 RepID=D8J5E1_HALJB|nr:bacterio-opsin activator domain-containing protein [Halalkalicoccus jeotgali]ADJ15637.1 bacterio-opsin activator-like protein [Halalkalicoccus jeotgali B3]ELY36592.1 bacterio-opsin activator-like protein [Halalkalicoccus jeotgali B3]